MYAGTGFELVFNACDTLRAVACVLDAYCEGGSDRGYMKWEGFLGFPPTCPRFTAVSLQPSWARWWCVLLS